MTLLWLILIVPGLIVAYAMILRPILSRVPAFHEFYVNADGFWAKVWAWCGNSMTIAWSKVVGGIGSGLVLLDPIAMAVGDPDLKAQATSLLQSNPKVLGYFLLGVSLITIFARIRSIGKAG